MKLKNIMMFSFTITLIVSAYGYWRNNENELIPTIRFASFTLSYIIFVSAYIITEAIENESKR